MALDITFLGHAGFLFKGASHAVAIDPWLTDNPVAKHAAEDIACDAIALTHGHFDHSGDAVSIAKRNGAELFGAFELVERFGAQGVEKGQPMNPGGKVETDFGWVALTHAFHSSSDADGAYTGMPCGVVLHLEGTTIYHLGDTGIFGDLALYGEIYRPDIAILPIGDRFTMGPELASRAAEMVKPRLAIPCHYKTFDMLVQDASKFVPSGIETKVLEPGESFTWEG